MAHRGYTAAALIGVTCFLGYHATFVQYDFGIKKLIPDRSSLYEAYQAQEKVFGRDDVQDIVAFRLPDLFEVSGMQHVRHLTTELESLDGVQSATSLSNVRRLVSDAGSIGVEALIPPEITKEALAQGLEIARTDPAIAGILLSESLDVASIVVRYDVSRGEAHRRIEIGREVEAILRREARPGSVYHRFGLPKMRNAYAEVMARENRVVIPGIILALIAMLFLFYRRLAGVLLPLGAVVVALIWCLGLTVLIDRPLNITTNLVLPIVLIVGIADAIHILNCYRERYAESQDQTAALTETFSEMGMSCLLTTFTTAVGFAALMQTEIPVLREFGFISAFGVFAAYFTTLLGLPVALSVVRPFAPPSGMRFGDWTSRSLVRLSAWVENRRVFILTVAALMAAVCASLAWELEHNARILEDLRPDHPAVHSRNFVEKHFGGGFLFSVLVRGAPGAFKAPSNVLAVDALVSDMGARPALGRPRAMTTVIGSLHSVLTTGSRFPKSRELLAQELLLYEMTGDEELWRFVSEDFSTARVVAWAKDNTAHQVEDLRHSVEKQANALFGPDLKVDVVSTMIMGHQLNNSLVRNTMLSFSGAFVVVLLTMWLMFGRLSLALLSLVPNIAPMGILLAFLAVTGIGLRVSTSFIFAVSFGIAVDDTIHFLARFRETTARGHSDLEGIRLAIVGSGRAMVQTTLVLMFGFSILLVSDFVASFNFGLLCGVALSSAVVADLTLLPALLLCARKKT